MHRVCARAFVVLGVFLLMVRVCCADPEPARSAALWAPDRTWVFVVGILEWQDAETWDSFPKEDRRDAELVEFFRAGGVPAERITYLQDREATLERIRAGLGELLAKTREGDCLFLYYAGHGYREEKTGDVAFANWDAGEELWATEEIAHAVGAGFRGRRVLLTADCCHSGALAGLARKHLAGREVACLASSLSRFESTGNWTFTECLLAGLRGEAALDRDRDGSVELDELGEYVLDRMAWHEEQLATYRLLGGLRGDTAVAPAREGAPAVAERRVEVLAEGEWWKALILRAEGKKSFVHYAGYGSEEDEWVGPDRIRPCAERTLDVGKRVRVEWEGEWYPARVEESSRGLHRVRYDGYGEEWDEWVGPRRIREKKKMR